MDKDVKQDKRINVIEEEKKRLAETKWFPKAVVNFTQPLE